MKIGCFRVSQSNPRTMGIDSSTTGVAWTVFEKAKPLDWGIIKLSQFTTMNQKLKYIAVEFPAILKKYKPDHVYIEKSIYVRSVSTMRVLSYVIGSIMTIGIQLGFPMIDIEPQVAKSFYGYTNLNRRFVAAAKKKLGKLEANKYCTLLRKSQIQRVNKHNFPDFDPTDNNISDACSIACKSWNDKISPIPLDTSREIRFDLEEFDRIGLVAPDSI